MLFRSTVSGESDSNSPSRSREGHTHRRARRSRQRNRRDFKEGSKSVKFLTFNGHYAQPEKAMQFVTQFDAAFGMEDFYEPSKLRAVNLHLTGAASAWWESLLRDGTASKHWKAFKKAFHKQFMPKPFRDQVIRSWDNLHVKYNQNLHKR